MSMAKHDPEAVLAFLGETIQDLVDVEPGDLGRDAVLEELGLISLDYVEIHVLTKREYGVGLSLELFVSGQVTTLGELTDYIVAQAAAGADAAAGAEAGG
jgi:acyl carrier protein